MPEKYTIIWKHFNKNTPIGKHLNAKENFSLPYFLEGEEKLKFEQREPVDLHAIHLINGLLVGYFDKPPSIDTSFAKAHALKIIEEQLTLFQSSSAESLIIDLSNYLRNTHGNQTSLQALITGAELLPNSSTIRYDGCIDLIKCIDESLLEDKIAASQKLKILLSEIDTSQLRPDLVNDYKQMVQISREQ